MPRKSITHKTLRFLYAKSGNNCAFPQCNAPIFEEDGLLTGECCHIEAISIGGARYNPKMTVEERNAEDNLVMMCSRHHTIIDADTQTYTVKRLQQIKREHEAQFCHNRKELDDNMLNALEKSITQYWSRLQAIDEEDNTGLKIKLDVDADVYTLLSSIEEDFNKLENILSDLAKSDEKRPNDLEQLCQMVGVDYPAFTSIPYWENCFILRNWETHALSVHNIIGFLKMYFLQFCVSVFSELTKYDSSYINFLNEYQYKLMNHQKSNFYCD